ncbi:MAG: hypothetical protein MK132_27345, partial [Lentisphaerales bacterium]|nr:hypothetical protein [Lentisphaerales bacterium]
MRGFDRIYTLVDESGNLTYDLADIVTQPITSDESGTFTATFTPPAGESGAYTAWATHPDRQDKPFESDLISGFVIDSLGWYPGQHVFKMPFDYQRSFTYNFTAGEGTRATNLRLEPVNVPAGVNLSYSSNLNLHGNRGSITVTASVEEAAGANVDLVFEVVSDEKESWGQTQLNLDLFVHEVDLVANMKISKNSIRTGVKYGETDFDSFNITSNGLVEIINMKFSLLNSLRQPVDPANNLENWVNLTSAKELSSLPVGSTHNVLLSFAPTVENPIPQGYYTFYVRMQADNFQTVDFPVFVTITTSETGNCLFKVVDIYTNWTDPETGKTSLGVENATINVQNVQLPSLIHQFTANERGEILFKNLEAGDWKFRASASGHESRGGTITIKPGITLSEVVTLPNSLVTVEWSVEPVTIVDRYEIILNTTFVTQVPAAVVVAEPASISMPALKTGETFTGEIVYTNHGSLRADELEFNFPKSNDNFKFEVLNPPPRNLAARQQYTMAYRVTCLQSPGEESLDPQSSGGYESIPDGYEVGKIYYDGDWSTEVTGDDCVRITTKVRSAFQYVCTYGTDIKEDFEVRLSTVENTGNCSGPAGGGPSGPGGSGPSGGGGTIGGGYNYSFSNWFNFNPGTASSQPQNLGDDPSICINLAWTDTGNQLEPYIKPDDIQPNNWTILKTIVDPKDEKVTYELKTFEPYNKEDTVEEPTIEVIGPNGVYPYAVEGEDDVNDTDFDQLMILAGKTPGIAEISAKVGDYEILTEVRVGSCFSCETDCDETENDNSQSEDDHGSITNNTALAGGVEGAPSLSTVMNPALNSSGTGFDLSSPSIGTPSMKRAKPGYKPVRMVPDGGDTEVLRQVETPKSVVDIVDNPNGSKSIRYYHISDIESVASDGLKTFKSDAQPHSRSVIRRNITAHASTIDIIHEKNGELHAISYYSTVTNGSKTRTTRVTKGVIRDKTIIEIEDLPQSQELPLTRTEEITEKTASLIATGSWEISNKRIISDSNSIISDKQQFIRLANGSIRKVYEESVINGVRESVSMNYITSIASPAFGRLHYRLHSNGTFERYEYDHMGRLSKQVNDLLGSDFDDPDSAHKVVDYTYANNLTYASRPASVITTLKGRPVSKVWFDYQAGQTTEIVAIRPDANIGDADNQRT